jgi:two-component system, OmpR family, KDP operon response regulator KdpE
MSRILVIDDDVALLRGVRVGLEALGHAVLTSTNGARGLSEAALSSPDVVVLDLGLPDLDGIEVCRRLRTWSNVPVVVLSADGTEDRKVAALDGGADDYMTKPFGMRELDARLRLAQRHRGSSAPEDEPSMLTLGSLEFDFTHQEARQSGRLLDLTPTEFAFLSFLARHSGRLCTHKMILGHVWGPRYVNEAGYLHAYAYRLRRKLNDEDGRLLITDPGVGYKLASGSE